MSTRYTSSTQGALRGQNTLPMTTRETLELVRAYYKIKDADVRKRVYELTKTLGADAGKDS